MINLQNTIFQTLPQKIIKLLISYPEQTFYERQIANSAKISIGGANQALQALTNFGLIKKETKGRMHFYQINLDNPLIKQIKIINNLIILQKILNKIKPYALKIILFGSAADGVNLQASDFDIYIESNKPDKIEKIINASAWRDTIQPIIKNPVAAEKFATENPTLWQEINHGLVIFEEGNGSRV